MLQQKAKHHFQFYASYVWNFFKSVTHMLLDPLLCHKLSHLLGPLERDALYGRPLRELFHGLENTTKFKGNHEMWKPPTFFLAKSQLVSASNAATPVAVALGNTPLCRITESIAYLEILELTFSWLIITPVGPTNSSLNPVAYCAGQCWQRTLCMVTIGSYLYEEVNYATLAETRRFPCSSRCLLVLTAAAFVCVARVCGAEQFFG